MREQAWRNAVKRGLKDEMSNEVNLIELDKHGLEKLLVQTEKNIHGTMREIQNMKRQSDILNLQLKEALAMLDDPARQPRALSFVVHAFSGTLLLLNNTVSKQDDGFAAEQTHAIGCGFKRLRPLYEYSHQSGLRLDPGKVEQEAQFDEAGACNCTTQRQLRCDLCRVATRQI